MQADDKAIFKQVSEKYNLKEEIVSEIGDFVFKAWREWQNAPDNLRLRVRGLGTQVVRKKEGINREIEDVFNSKYDYIDETNNEFKSEDSYLKYKSNQAWYQNMFVLRDLYKKYSLEKAEIRKKRNEVQKPLKKLSSADLQQKKSKETGEDFSF